MRHQWKYLAANPDNTSLPLIITYDLDNKFIYLEINKNATSEKMTINEYQINEITLNSRTPDPPIEIKQVMPNNSYPFWNTQI